MSSSVTGTATPPPTQPEPEPTPEPEPEPEPQARPRATFIAAGAAAIVAAVTLSWDRPGLGWPLTSFAAAAAVLVAVRSQRRSDDAGRVWSRRGMVRAGWAAAAVLLLAVGAVRAADWLFVLCVLTAGLVGCVALVDRWSVGGTLLAPLRVIRSTPAALHWLGSGGVRVRGPHRDSLVRTLVAGLTTVVLLVVFGLLLTDADPEFARVLSTMAPSLDGGTLFRWVWSAAVAVTVIAVVAHLLLCGVTAPVETSPPRLVRCIEWALPVGGLVVLFARFVAVQATVLFGGGEHVLATSGLTYAEYARTGFWQLLAVTALTVIVVAVAARIAPRSTPTDRALLRTLLGLLSALTLVIVASALSRMAAYEQAYGFTRQRLLVTACELWLGAVFLLILAAGVRLRGWWVPRAALAAAVAALVGLAVLNPDAFIVRQNVARFVHGKAIDVNYLGTLSADAVPALQALPEPYRSCALSAANFRLAAGRPDAWFEWNLGRGTARAILHDHPPAPGSCPP